MGQPDVAIYHAPPRLLASLITGVAAVAPEMGSCKRVGMTTWETTYFPHVHAGPLIDSKLFDAVIVPSQFCRDVIFDDDPRTPVEIVPHCFDEDFWPTPALPAPFGNQSQHAYPQDPCRFYAIGAWGERKNMLGVIRAYVHEFTRDDNVELQLVIDKVELDEVRSLLARTGLPMDRLPRLTIPAPGSLSEQQLVELHAGGHCYVSAARGEGWGLGMFEAAIMGNDVISPAFGGQVDFLESYGGYQAIDYSLTPCMGSETRDRVVQHEGQTMQRSVVTIPPGVNSRQLWAEPDLEGLAIAMRAVYAGRMERTLEERRTDRAALELRFGYRTVGPQLAQLLRGI